MINTSRKPFLALRSLTSILLVLQFLFSPLGTLAIQAQGIPQQRVGEPGVLRNNLPVQLAQAATPLPSGGFLHGVSSSTDLSKQEAGLGVENSSQDGVTTLLDATPTVAPGQSYTLNNLVLACFTTCFSGPAYHPFVYSNLPPETNPSFVANPDPVSIGQVHSMTITPGVSTVPGQYFVYILAQNIYTGSVSVSYANTNINVAPIISIAPPAGSSSTATVNPGGVASYNLKLNIPSNYPANLAMGIDVAGSSPQIAGTSYAFNPPTVSFNSNLTTLVATISNTTPPGTFNIKVTATPTPGSPGVNIPPFIATIVVSAPPVTTPPVITANPSSLVLQAGQTNNATTISLQRNGLVGTVNLQVLSVNNATPGLGYQVVPTAVPDLYNLNLATTTQSTTPPNVPAQFVIGASNAAQGIPNIVFPLTVTAPAQPMVKILDASNNDITGKIIEVKVGQKIQISARLSTDSTGSATTGKWTVPGYDATPPYAIADWRTVDQSKKLLTQSAVVPLDMSTLSQQTLVFYWVAPSLPATVANGFAQSNQDVTFKANGVDTPVKVTFTVQQPAVSIGTPDIYGEGTAVGSYVGTNCDATKPQFSFSIHLGHGCGSGFYGNGIAFSKTPSADLGDEYAWTQIILNRANTYTGTKNGVPVTGRLGAAVTNELDIYKDGQANPFTNFPYAYPSANKDTGLYADSPATPLDRVRTRLPTTSDFNVSKTFSARTWLMYRPNLEGAIGVPIAYLPWVSNGTASSSSGRSWSGGGTSRDATAIALVPTRDFPAWTVLGTSTNFTARTSPTLPDLGSGPVGSTFIINGAGFSNVEGATISTIPAQTVVLSDTQVQVTVPPGATTGKVVLVWDDLEWAVPGTFTVPGTVPGGRPDLVALNTISTGSGKAEIHALSSYPSSNYQKPILDVATLYNLNPANILQMIDIDRNGIPDLAILNQTATGSGKTEIHVLSDSSNYQSSILDVAVNNGLSSRNKLQMADMDGDRKPDLVVLNNGVSGTDPTTLYVFSAASNYQTQTLGVVTAFAYDPNNIYEMIDIDLDGKADLVALNQTSTGSGKTEIHVLSAATNFQSSILDTTTGVGTSANNTNKLQMIDMDGDRKLDLVVLNNGVSGTDPTTIYAFSASSNFQSQILGVVSALPYNPNNILRMVNFGVEPNDLTTYNAPVINSFTPISGFVGATVKITGSGFTGATGVNFFGTPSTSYFVSSDTQMTATVPSVTKSSGSIGVRTNSGVASSSTNFTISAPVISGFNFTTVPVGGTLIISGSNLSGATSVKINGVAVPFTADSSITVLIPSGITSGLVSVTTLGGTATSTTTLSVPAAPLDVYTVIEDGSLLVLKSFVQYYSGYPTPPPGSANSPRNPAYRYNITPASRTTTVGCFTGASACPTVP
jgi:hypothetical protein